ncbi:MAG: hypothetical protein V3U17_03605 [Thermoplasmata archaeon]
MFDRYGMAVVEERRNDRRFAALGNYLRMEYGTTSGMDRYIARANHDSSLRPGLRAFLAGIARMVSRFPARALPAATVRRVLSEECVEQLTRSKPTVDATEEIRWQA